MRSEISYTLTAHYERARHQNIVWFRQKRKYKYNHTSRNSNQSKNIPGITPTSICRCTTKGRESLDRTCLWKQQAWAGRGKWIQLWNLLQEYVLNTFYAEGRLKNERA